MKLFTILIVLTLAIYSHQVTYLPPDVAKKNRDDCFKKSSVDPADIDQFKSGTVPTDEKFKCYLKCVFVIANRMDENGIILPGAFDTTVPSFVDLDKAADIIPKCKDLKGNSPCDNAYVIGKCMKEANMA